MNRKYIIPLALVKILLGFLIIHLLFSSCEEEFFYEGNLYTDGPRIELEADFGEGNHLYHQGDTVILDIALNQLSMKDVITGADVILNKAQLHSYFCIINKEGQKIRPAQTIVYSGEYDIDSDNSYQSSFGYNVSNAESRSSLNGKFVSNLPHLRLGFVFEAIGDYVIYFVNTPNSQVEAGGVDIYYNYEDGEAQSKAYAEYLFNKSEDQDHNITDDVRSEVLKWCAYEKSYIDFTISNKE